MKKLLMSSTLLFSVYQCQSMQVALQNVDTAIQKLITKTQQVQSPHFISKSSSSLSTPKAQITLNNMPQPRSSIFLQDNTQVPFTSSNQIEIATIQTPKTTVDKLLDTLKNKQFYVRVENLQSKKNPHGIFDFSLIWTGVIKSINIDSEHGDSLESFLKTINSDNSLMLNKNLITFGSTQNVATKSSPGNYAIFVFSMEELGGHKNYTIS